MNKELQEVTQVVPLDGYRVRVTFADGFIREIDLGPALVGPIFEQVRDPQFFRGVAVSESGVISWPNEADIDSDTLRYWCELGRVASGDETDAYFAAQQKTARVAEET